MDLPQEFYHPIFSEKRVALEYIILEKLIIDTMELFKIIWSRNKGSMTMLIIVLSSYMELGM